MNRLLHFFGLARRFDLLTAQQEADNYKRERDEYESLLCKSERLTQTCLELLEKRRLEMKAQAKTIAYLQSQTRISEFEMRVKRASGLHIRTNEAG